MSSCCSLKRVLEHGLSGVVILRMMLLEGVASTGALLGVEAAEAGKRMCRELLLLVVAGGGGATLLGLLPWSLGDMGKIKCGVGGQRTLRPEPGVARCAGVRR